MRVSTGLHIGSTSVDRTQETPRAQVVTDHSWNASKPSCRTVTRKKELLKLWFTDHKGLKDSEQGRLTVGWDERGSSRLPSKTVRVMILIFAGIKDAYSSDLQFLSDAKQHQEFEASVQTAWRAVIGIFWNAP